MSTKLCDRVGESIATLSPEAKKKFDEDLANPGPWNYRAGRDEVAALNSFLRHKLCMLTRNTMEERDYLCDPSDQESWLNNFNRVILNPLVNEVYKNDTKQKTC